MKRRKRVWNNGRSVQIHADGQWAGWQSLSPDEASRKAAALRELAASADGRLVEPDAVGLPWTAMPASQALVLAADLFSHACAVDATWSVLVTGT